MFFAESKIRRSGILLWSEWGESNPLESCPQNKRFPTKQHPDKMVRKTGVEPAKVFTLDGFYLPLLLSQLITM